jgi:hypothetical protein
MMVEAGRDRLYTAHAGALSSFCCPLSKEKRMKFNERVVIQGKPMN